MQCIVQQFAAFGGTRFWAGSADHDADHAAAVALAGGNQVIACAGSVACFQTVHAVVAKQQQIAVFLRDVVIGE